MACASFAFWVWTQLAATRMAATATTATKPRMIRDPSGVVDFMTISYHIRCFKSGAISARGGSHAD
jgi:hypothetical protein